MHPIEHIRKNVFGLTQGELATVAGVSQPTVCRWEAGSLEPNRTEMQRIRDEARSRGLPWDDSLFFETPVAEAAE